MSGKAKTHAKKRKSKKNKENYKVIRTEEAALVKTEAQKALEGEVVNGPGRPTRYSKKLARQICAGIALGNSLRTVLKAEGMPAMSTVFLWLEKYGEFSEQYTHACEERAEAMHEDILDIADDGTNDWMEIEFENGYTKEVLNREAVERSKLRVETRKWLMARMKPKKYGDKLDLTSDGEALPTPITALQVNLPGSEAQQLPAPDNQQ